MIAVVNGIVITPCRAIEDGVVLAEDSRVVAVGPRGLLHLPPAATVFDARGGYIVPGFIDLHCHGALGVNVNDPGTTAEDLCRIAQFEAQHGTTAFLLAVPTGSHAVMAKALSLIHEATGTDKGAQLLGAQAEGPYFNPAAKGAQAVEHMRPPDILELEEWLRICPELKLVSLAPEMPGALEFIAHARRKGLTLAVGHSRASYEEVLAAVAHGLSHATHTFNGMLGLHHREPCTVGAILTCDDITAEVIADNIHLHPSVVDLVVRCKGLEHTVLITDAMSATGLPDGQYSWDGRPVTVEKGAVRLPDGTIAGSTLTMERAVANAMADAGLTLAQAVRLATLNPAMAIGVADRKGRLAPGQDADIVILDKELEVRLTLVRGKVAYENH
jgi:N-acetylglucosamine-6-phosphate deacetylase